jgi:two-component system, LytTR family, sensor kinase
MWCSISSTTDERFPNHHPSPAFFGMQPLSPSAAPSRADATAHHSFPPDQLSKIWWGARREFWIVQLIGWTTTGVCGFLIATRLGFDPASIAWVVTLRSLIGLTATTFLLRPWLRHLLAKKMASGFVASGTVAACVGVTILDQLIVALLLPGQDSPDETISLNELVGSFLPLRLIAYIIWCAAYLLIRHWILRRESEWRIARAEAATAKAELELLRAQVDPHFIFNVLNSILAVAGDAERVSMMIQSLSRHLRFAIEPGHDAHALRDELDAVENYIEIERFRFEEGLSYQSRVDPDCLRLAVPAGCLMIPVENAIKHGAATSPRPLRVALSASHDNDRLQLEVSNTGQWKDADPGHNGLGMPNLRNTLARLYGADSSVAVESHSGRVTVKIQMPATPA